MKRFGKSSRDVIKIKQSFVDDNESLKADQARVTELYRAQPRRDLCKNCEAPMAATSFIKLDVDYSLCSRCGHLNGAHDDTEDFCAAAYTTDHSAGYARKYSSKDREAYDTRTREIYVPKAEFLRDALASEGRDPSMTSFADIGAGSGYMVAALRSLGIRNVVGYEASALQVALGNSMIDEGALRQHRLEDVNGIVEALEADVVCMIGVLEHLRDPRGMLRAISSNPRISYFYFSLPLFSATVFFEMMFPQILQGQLAGRHTHLYTESSIDWFCKEFGFTRKAEWWFGSDMMHLFRHVSVRLRQQEQPGQAVTLWQDSILPALDTMQLALDEKRLSSEVHMLVHVAHPSVR